MFGFEGKPGTYRIRSGFIVVGETGKVEVAAQDEADDLKGLGFTAFDPQAEQKAQAAIAAKAAADAKAAEAQAEFDARVNESVKAQVAAALAAHNEQIQAAVDAAVAAALAANAKPAKGAKAPAEVVEPDPAAPVA